MLPEPEMLPEPKDKFIWPPIFEPFGVTVLLILTCAWLVDLLKSIELPKYKSFHLTLEWPKFKSLLEFEPSELAGIIPVKSSLNIIWQFSVPRLSLPLAVPILPTTELSFLKLISCPSLLVLFKNKLVLLALVETIVPLPSISVPETFAVWFVFPTNKFPDASILALSVWLVLNTKG